MSSEKFEEKRISVVEEHEGPQATSDESRLESLGYKQDLKREMSMVSVLGLAFCCEYCSCDYESSGLL